MYSALREMEPVSPTELARHLGMPVTTALDGVRAMAGHGHVPGSTTRTTVGRTSWS